jgi:hypothetical protein
MSPRNNARRATLPAGPMRSNPECAMLVFRPDDISWGGYCIICKEADDLERCVGRVFKSKIALPGLRWCWTISFFERRGSGPHQGFEATLEEAMQASTTAWDSIRQAADAEGKSEASPFLQTISGLR